MFTTVRALPRWLLAAAVAALLVTGIALSGAGGVRAQDSSDATPTAEATDTATATATATATDSSDNSTAAAATTGDGVFAVGNSVVVADGPLNLRSDAGTDADVLLKLPTGTLLTVTDGPNSVGDYTWYEVQTNAGDTGWVAGEFLADGDVPIYAEGDEVEVTDGPLNVRADASLDADVLTQLATGDTATVVSGPVNADDYNWYEVTLSDDSTGWIASEFVDAVGSSDGGTGDADFAVGGSVTAAVEDMNFRADAGTDAEVLDTLDAGALFIVRDGPVSADGYTWYKVFNYYYGEGWVAGELMSPSSTPFPAEEGS